MTVRMRTQLLFWAAYLSTVAYQRITTPTKENPRADLPQ